jgi:hypothetical protein
MKKLLPLAAIAVAIVVVACGETESAIEKYIL